MHVEWFVDELGPPERVTLNVSFGPVQERLGTDAGNVLAPVDVSLMDGPQNPAWGRLLGEDGAAFELRGAPLIGRGEPASLLLSDPTVSTRHARLVREASGRVFLEDLGSANGTWVNGQEVDRVVRLRHSDRVEFGDRVFRFEEVSAGTP